MSNISMKGRKNTNPAPLQFRLAAENSLVVHTGDSQLSIDIQFPHDVGQAPPADWTSHSMRTMEPIGTGRRYVMVMVRLT